MNLIDWEIIYRKINATISKQEEIKLENWLKASLEHRLYYEKVVKFYQEDKNELAMVPSQVDCFMSKLDGRRRSLFFGKMARYAALIAIPVSIALSIFFMSGLNEYEQFVQYSKNEIVNPIEKNTVLITSNGKIHNLNLEGAQDINDESGIAIQRHKEFGLKYENKEQIGSNKIVYNTLRTVRGGAYKVVLADGTRVQLNCDSELRYPVVFKNGPRRVELKGEAFFEVTTNGNPFVVELGDVEVKVLGTRFNVKAYKEDKKIQTTLLSGKVKVIARGGNELESIDLSPGEQANCMQDGSSLSSVQVDTGLYTGWLDGYFRFENQRMEDLMKNISRWYDVKIFYQNADLKDKRLTGKLHRFDDFKVISSLIEKISGVKIKKDNKAVLITNVE